MAVTIYQVSLYRDRTTQIVLEILSQLSGYYTVETESPIQSRIEM
jgi:hypothetical protein